MLNATQKLDWHLILLLLLLIDTLKKFSGVVEICWCCWFRPMVKINPSRFLSPLCCSPPLPKSVSLSVCLSLCLASFPIMFYLSWFHIKTSWFACLNKLFDYTSLFTWKSAYNIFRQWFQRCRFVHRDRRIHIEQPERIKTLCCISKVVISKVVMIKGVISKVFLSIVLVSSTKM
jgi:hypothetical protein